MSINRVKIKRAARTGFRVVYSVILMAVFFVALPGTVSAAPGEVAVTDENIIWSPYSWEFSGSTYAQTPTTGSYLKVAFTGTTLALDLDTQTFDDPNPDVNPAQLSLAAYIDGSTTPIRKTLSELSGETLTFSSALSDGDHYAQIFVSSNASYANRWGAFYPTQSDPTAVIRITAIQLDVDAQTLSLANTPLAEKEMKIIYYGDSITDGNNIGGTYAEESHAARVAQGLGVEHKQHGFASLAWGASFLSSAPNFYYRNAGGEEPVYDLSTWRNKYSGAPLIEGGNLEDGFVGGNPDAIFNNMGINDYGARDSGWTSSSDMKARIKEWLVDVRTALGERPAVFMVVPFNYGNSGGDDIPEFRTAYLEAISEYQAENPDDNRVYTIDLGEAGWNIVDTNSTDDLHPNPTGAQLLADAIIEEAGVLGEKIIADEPLTGLVNGEEITDGMVLDEMPSFSGTAPAQSTITVTVNSDPITCEATADVDGEWQCDFGTAIPAGDHTLTITAETLWGETLSLASASVSVLGEDSALAETGTSVYLAMIAGLALIGASLHKTWQLIRD